MNGPEIAIGSRGSALALAQARLVHEALHHEGRASRVVIIETEGDRRAPDTAWGEGAFVAAIERALQDGAVDIAVHSAKDVPTDQDPRLRIAAYLPRADPRDALVVRTDAKERRLADLPSGCRVGTDSPRRTGFLLARRPDLVVHPLHGNVDTRLRRLDAGETDALVLACAGLDRIGRGDRIAERIDPETLPPAPGQGAIAVQVRSDDAEILRGGHGDRRSAHAPGGRGRADISQHVRGRMPEPDRRVGHRRRRRSGPPRRLRQPGRRRTAIARRHGPVASSDDLARDLAAELDSAARIRTISGDVPRDGERSSPRRVLVTRAADQAAELVLALRDAGLDPVVVPAIAIEFEPPRGDLDAAAGLLHTYRWVVITSANGARAILKAATRILTELGIPFWAAVGPATALVLDREGIEVQFQPSEASSERLAAELPIVAGDRVVVIRGDLAGDGLALTLRGRGAEVDDVIGYRTREAPKSSRGLLRRAISEGPIAAVAFTSGSTVRGLISLAKAELIDVRSFPAMCIGPETADEARSAGFRILAVAPRPDATTLAAATATALARQPEETP